MFRDAAFGVTRLKAFEEADSFVPLDHIQQNLDCQFAWFVDGATLLLRRLQYHIFLDCIVTQLGRCMLVEKMVLPVERLK